jgi:Flp pilus assembly protein TadG
MHNASHFRTRNGERGVAIYITAAALLFLIPMAGLAIDGGMAFLIKSRLGGAMDAAALAAGRSVSLGNDVSGAETAAQTAALTFFNSNFPSGYMNTDTSNRSVSATLTPQTNGTLLINVTGSVSIPTYFMRWVGVNNITVSAKGQATRRNLVMMLVLDKSSSMGSRTSSVGTMPTSIDYSSAQSCEAMVYTAGQFIQNFSPYDTIGLVTFNNTATLDYSPSTNFKSSGSAGITQAIANISCGGNTNTTGALNLAASQITSVGQKLALNHIVLFTDGVANGVNADFPIRTQVDTRLGPMGVGTAPTTPSGNPTNCSDTSGTKECVNMPACTTTAGTLRAVLAQAANFSVNGGSRNLNKSLSTDSTPTAPSGCPNSDTARTSQTIAYIPDTDRFGNSTSGPWDNTLEQVNQHCAPSGAPITPGNSSCKNLTDLWSNYSTVGYGAPSNKYTSGPYSGKFRVDTPNAIGVTSMNSAVNQASTIRGTADYNITIDSIYLQGNGSDPVAPSFIQIVSNQKNLQSSIYEASTYPYTPTYTTNPYYQSSQAVGIYAETSSTTQLATAFSQIASSLLRISQ